jgi:hypothetical protein
MSDKTLVDREFGELRFNKDLRWWHGKIDLSPGHKIDIAFVPEDEEPSSLLDRVRPIFWRIARNEKEYRAAAAGQLLDLHNNTWNDDEPIDSQTFIDRMLLESIVFYSDGSSEMFYQDGDLFLGHAIFVSVDSQGVAQRAAIGG